MNILVTFLASIHELIIFPGLLVFLVSYLLYRGKPWFIKWNKVFVVCHFLSFNSWILVNVLSHSVNMQQTVIIYPNYSDNFALVFRFAFFLIIGSASWGIGYLVSQMVKKFIFKQNINKTLSKIFILIILISCLAYFVESTLSCEWSISGCDRTHEVFDLPYP